MANIDEVLTNEMNLDAEICGNIKQIAKKLYDNVCPRLYAFRNLIKKHISCLFLSLFVDGFNMSV